MEACGSVPPSPLVSTADPRSSLLPFSNLLEKTGKKDLEAIWPFLSFCYVQIAVSCSFQRQRVHLQQFISGLLRRLRITGSNDGSRFNIWKAYRNFFDDPETDRDIASLSKNPVFWKSLRGQSTFPGISHQNLTSNSVPTNILAELDILILFQPL